MPQIIFMKLSVKETDKVKGGAPPPQPEFIGTKPATCCSIILAAGTSCCDAFDLAM